MSKHYIDRHEFHAEMRSCKLNDRISDTAVSYFYKLAKKVSKRYNLQESDRDDAIQSAVMDCIKYWGNFKEGRITRIGITRNFKNGEGFIVKIDGRPDFKLIAGTDFDISRNNHNKTMSNIIRTGTDTNKNKTSGKFDNGSFGIYLDKMRGNMTFMDIYNRRDLETVSSIKIIQDEKNRLIKEEDNEFEFEKPNNAFSYFTSMVNNGMLKFMGQLSPKDQKDTVVLSIEGINSDGNGMYNI
jgi:hypothetical protein